jgi:hypothetical protein
VAIIGTPLEADQLVLTTGRDFKWSFQNLDEFGAPTNFPAGTLFFELQTSPVTEWDFTIDGDTATIKVESVDADLIPARTKWQLVFTPTGEPAGGDPIALGSVKRQG